METIKYQKATSKNFIRATDIALIEKTMRDQFNGDVWLRAVRVI